jgi:hypothetical protein
VAAAVPQLERLRRSIVGESNPAAPPEPLSPREFKLTHAVLDTLGIGLEPIHRFLFSAQPTAAELEAWVESEVGGELDPGRVERANQIAEGRPPTPAEARRQAELRDATNVLSEGDLGFWDEHGYVIVRDAAPADARRALELAIWEHLGADPEAPETWYGVELQQGIMVQLFRAPGIDEIHAAPRIRKPFAQLLGTSDLVMTADRCGFNAPLRPGERWEGMRLHLDLDSYAPPIRAPIQAILYLTDTSEEQGAFRCVPGFHERIDEWAASLGASDPTLFDFEQFGPRSVAAGPGDLIIWNGALPHGSQPNMARRPRLVHYLTMYPAPAG